jgi:hypothetical protein
VEMKERRFMVGLEVPRRVILSESAVTTATALAFQRRELSLDLE